MQALIHCSSVAIVVTYHSLVTIGFLEHVVESSKCLDKDVRTLVAKLISEK